MRSVMMNLGLAALLLGSLGLLAPQDASKSSAALIQEHAPAEAYAQPEAPRKLLVFTLCRGFRHASIPVGVEALETMGQKTGAYAATVSEDPAVFEPDSLRRFDAVCFLNTTGELFRPADMDKRSPAEQEQAAAREKRLKQSLLDFVRGGKGIVGIHAATDCFYEWPEFGEMMGGYFDGHPWGAGDTVTIRVEEPQHPLCRMFPSRFDLTEEIYQFRDEPYSRARLRVLLSLDPERTDLTKPGVKRQDKDFAVSWVRPYGKGRVFYTSLGHREDIFWNPQILRHYLAGIQFALGDLKAEAEARN